MSKKQQYQCPQCLLLGPATLYGKLLKDKDYPDVVWCSDCDCEAQLYKKAKKFDPKYETKVILEKIAEARDNFFEHWVRPTDGKGVLGGCGRSLNGGESLIFERVNEILNEAIDAQILGVMGLEKDWHHNKYEFKRNGDDDAAQSTLVAYIREQAELAVKHWVKNNPDFFQKQVAKQLEKLTKQFRSEFTHSIDTSLNDQYARYVETKAELLLKEKLKAAIDTKEELELLELAFKEAGKRPEDDD